MVTRHQVHEETASEVRQKAAIATCCRLDFSWLQWHYWGFCARRRVLKVTINGSIIYLSGRRHFRFHFAVVQPQRIETRDRDTRMSFPNGSQKHVLRHFLHIFFCSIFGVSWLWLTASQIHKILNSILVCHSSVQRSEIKAAHWPGNNLWNFRCWKPDHFSDSKHSQLGRGAAHVVDDCQI